MPVYDSESFVDTEDPGTWTGEGRPRGQTLVEHYNAHYGRYIDLVDQLRTFGLEKEVPLPQVVVTGIQSSGKSSVLESISGVPLPRGTGTVTRTAVELRLHYQCEGRWTGKLYCKNDEGTEHAETLRTPMEVADAIRKATVFLAGETGISDRAIIIDICAPNVPDLTLIDLPGLIEMPMEGQPEDICEKIEKLVVEYISKMEALILVVVAANTEIATSKALRLAKVADPQGRRTIGVITKVDMAASGTEHEITRMVFEPAKYKIQKGFVLVKLRSQEDINNKVSLMQAVENEMCYFKDQSPYRALPDSTVGTNSLSNKLTWELVERIKTVLPSLKEETQKKMKETDAELKRMGEGIPKDSDELRKYISQKFLDFTKRMTRICDGLYDQEDPIDMRLLLHTRPAMEEFADAVNKLMPAASDEDLVERVTDEIRTQRGEELPHFLPYRACQVVVSNLLKEYTVPASNCLNSFNVIVDNFLRRLTEQYFDYFPRMKNEIKLVIDDLRTTAFDVCEAAIKDIFEIEYMVIIPDKLFFKMEAKEREAADKPPIQNNQFKGSDFTIRQIIIYFKSALDRITATVPMRIHYNLVKMLSRNIEIKVTSMALDSAVVGLLTEDDTTAKRRSDLEERLSRLDMSYKELARF